MNSLPELCFSMESYLFPVEEEEIGEITAKMKEFLRILELVRPSRFINSALRWSGLGRPMKNREKMLRAFFLKAVYDLPTTKVLIENLKINPSYRRLCGWEYRGEVPSESTFCRAFSVFAEENVLESIHGTIIQENYTDKLVGHASHGFNCDCGKRTCLSEKHAEKEAWTVRLRFSTVFRC